MRILYGTYSLLLLLLLTSPAACFGQERDMRLTASITSERYCTVGPQVDSLQLTLTLRYTNTGSRKRILYKGDRLFYQIFVSRSPKDDAAMSYELRTTHARFYDEVPEKLDGSSPGAVFVTLPPGASYETRQVVGLPVAHSGEGRFNAYLGEGEHTLHLQASTWYESRARAQELRARWQRSGLLWTEPLASNLLSFVVNADRKAVACK